MPSALLQWAQLIRCNKIIIFCILMNLIHTNYQVWFNDFFLFDNFSSFDCHYGSEGEPDSIANIFIGCSYKFQQESDHNLFQIVCVAVCWRSSLRQLFCKLGSLLRRDGRFATEAELFVCTRGSFWSCASCSHTHKTRFLLVMLKQIKMMFFL